ncbi:ATP-binding protein [Candidatus Calescamantes bacterium]|nr:ATP-binding protein [Candidatus Calescamantes bacterium]
MEELKKWIDRREIYAIKGPRQSGKTTVLKIFKEWLIQEKKIHPENILFLTCEDPEILEKFSASPKDFIRSFIGSRKERFYFLIDEFQYLPEGGKKLKLLYDLFENVKFIVTGSSSLELTGKTGKFLVGRLFSFYLYQLSFEEFLQVKFPQLSNVYQERAYRIKSFIEEGKDFSIPKEEIFARDFEKAFGEYVIWGGYPEVIKTDDGETKMTILKNIFQTYITRDIVELLRIKDFSKLRTVITLLSTRTGSLINYNDLGNSANIYFKELKHYLSILEETFIISLIKPFFSNKTTELKKNPKVYFTDNGLRNYILRNFNELSLRPDRGAIVENEVFNQLKIKEGEKYEIKYWRTLSKAEIDFVLQQNDFLLPIEVKYSPLKSPEISRSYRNFLSQYRPDRAIVLTKNFWGELKIDKTLIKFIPVWYL